MYGPFIVASSTRIRFAVSLQLPRATAPSLVRRVEVVRVQVAQDDQEIIARVAAQQLNSIRVGGYR